jgi:DNA-binding transcriptional regulator YhcF (GntR family)
MTNNTARKELDGTEVWKQFEDVLVPRLRLTVMERAVYSHLLRHSRLEGKTKLRFSIQQVARDTGISTFSVRKAVRRLVVKGAVLLAERNKKGHFVQVQLPEEIRAVRSGKEKMREPLPSGANIEEIDFMQTKRLRAAIHAREGEQCFYCRRKLTKLTHCVDHVVPSARLGCNSYRNLVSACAECNALKSDQPAQDYLRRLYREGRLTSEELSERLTALEKLAAGELRPEWESVRAV